MPTQNQITSLYAKCLHCSQCNCENSKLRKLLNGNAFRKLYLKQLTNIALYSVVEPSTGLGARSHSSNPAESLDCREADTGTSEAYRQVWRQT